MNYDYEDARRIYNNCVRSGVPVIPWEDFVAAGTEMVAADQDFRSAVREADARLDEVEPLPRYAGWQNYSNDEARAIDELLLDAAEVNTLHPSDFRFRLAYGKSRRNPMAGMAARAKGLRSAAGKIRAGLAKARDAAPVRDRVG